MEKVVKKAIQPLIDTILAADKLVDALKEASYTMDEEMNKSIWKIINEYAIVRDSLSKIKTLEG